MERFEEIHQAQEKHIEGAVFYVPIEKVRVSEKQYLRISQDKINKHKEYLLKHDDDLLPIDANELADGTFVINGNGRHRFFAYKELGYNTVPLNIKGREGFRPITKRKRGVREKTSNTEASNKENPL